MYRICIAFWIPFRVLRAWCRLRGLLVDCHNKIIHSSLPLRSRPPGRLVESTEIGLGVEMRAGQSLHLYRVVRSS